MIESLPGIGVKMLRHDIDGVEAASKQSEIPIAGGTEVRYQLTHLRESKPVDGHLFGSGPGREERDVRIDLAHRLSEHVVLDYELVERHYAELPRPVHFIADSPPFNVVRRRVAVGVMPLNQFVVKHNMFAQAM